MPIDDKPDSLPVELAQSIVRLQKLSFAVVFGYDRERELLHRCTYGVDSLDKVRALELAKQTEECWLAIAAEPESHFDFTAIERGKLVQCVEMLTALAAQYHGSSDDPELSQRYYATMRQVREVVPHA